MKTKDLRHKQTTSLQTRLAQNSPITEDTKTDDVDDNNCNVAAAADDDDGDGMVVMMLLLCSCT